MTKAGDIRPPALALIVALWYYRRKQEGVFGHRLPPTRSALSARGRLVKPMERRKVIIFLISLLVVFILLTYFAPKAM